MRKRILILSAALVGILLFEAGCASSNDPGKRRKRALAGGATSTVLGVATGVGGPILLARAALGAASRVATGEAMDSIKNKDKGKDKEDSEQPVEETGSVTGRAALQQRGTSSNTSV